MNLEFAGVAWAALRGKRSTARSTDNGVNMMATRIAQPPHGSPAWFHRCVEQAADSPKMEIVQLTPSLAKAMLDVNPSNRSVKKAKLVQYSSDMAAGKWSLNGEPIIVSKDGKLNDGQHRCLAVIDANATVPVTIVFGIDRETRLTVDQGGARTAGDFLGMEGVQNSALVAAIARMALAYERNGGQGLGSSQNLSNTEVRDRVYADAALAEAATFGSTNAHYSRQFAPASIIGFAYYILARVNRGEARTFLERTCRGDGLKMRDPAHTLREKLLGGRTTRDRKLVLIFKAWNFHRRGIKVSPQTLNSTLPFPALI